MTTTTSPNAPAFDPGAVGLPWHRRAWRQGAAYLLPNLIFLTLPAAFAGGDLPTWRYATMILTLVGIGVVFLGVTVVASWSESVRWVWVGLLAGLVVLLAIIDDDASLIGFFNPFVTSGVAMLIPWRSARTVILATTTLGLGIAVYEAELFAGVLALTGLMIGYSVGQGLATAWMEAQLQEAQERTAVLAVAAERERIGRDLHDILGHSLTTIAVKADLATRLATRDPEASRAEIQEVAAIARQALADVRATASGMREVRLASEIASARSVLLAAGIHAETPSAMPMLSDEDSQLMGYVVREAVTNVLRHSGATNCHIRVTDDTVEVSDDGVGLQSGRPRSGLKGLEERLSHAGWALVVEGNGGTMVRAERGTR